MPKASKDPSLLGAFRFCLTHINNTTFSTRQSSHSHCNSKTVVKETFIYHLCTSLQDSLLSHVWRSLNSSIGLQAQEQTNPSHWSHGVIWQDFCKKVNFVLLCAIPNKVYLKDLVEDLSVPVDVLCGPVQSTVRLINPFYSISSPVLRKNNSIYHVTFKMDGDYTTATYPDLWLGWM